MFIFPFSTLCLLEFVGLFFFSIIENQKYKKTWIQLVSTTQWLHTNNNTDYSGIWLDDIGHLYSYYPCIRVDHLDIYNYFEEFIVQDYF